MFKALSLVMNGIPGHVEYLQQHAFDQMMAKNGALGDGPPFVGQPNAAVFGDPQQAILG